ncbi:MAG: serine/threonine-protein phosphatase [Nocardioidaceae bacterium]|nr:serine/threonine-protein phosphatase [Nocardioidaceae bacterium]NUS50486.1 serine/threonine-protein phosphatase [Nocardioidaceae bacterium]
MLRFSSSGRSHPGLVRGNNEDAGFAGPYLQVVADGVGGAAAGEVASATAAYVVSALAGASSGRDPADVLTHAVQVVHEQLVAGTAAVPERAGMGTTLTALLVDEGRCALAHVGDSRAYVLRDGELSQVTRDHTYVQTLVDAGVISREEARRHPRKNVVINALEASTLAKPDVTVVGIVEGDRFLLCSDGLTDLVDDDTIARCLDTADPDDAVARLVQAALDAGGTDNVTALVSDVVDGPRLVPDGSMFGAFADPTLVVDPAAVHTESAG